MKNTHQWQWAATLCSGVALCGTLAAQTPPPSTQPSNPSSPSPSSQPSPSPQSSATELESTEQPADRSFVERRWPGS